MGIWFVDVVRPGVVIKPFMANLSVVFESAFLYRHRVGRVARAGQSGTAISLVGPDELGHVLDLHLFLGRPLTLVSDAEKQAEVDGLFGRVPQHCVEEFDEKLRSWNRLHDIVSARLIMVRCCVLVSCIVGLHTHV